MRTGRLIAVAGLVILVVNAVLYFYTPFLIHLVLAALGLIVAVVGGVIWFCNRNQEYP